MPSSDVQTRPYATLIAGMIITGTLGSIHAFSVFVPAIESELAISRSTVSSLYSLALLCLTLSVLLGHHVYSRAAPYVIAAASCSVAALGLGIAAQSSHMTGLYLGYSVMFGAANGVGYGFSLQLVAQAMPARRGFAMGIVTATYAVGATLFSKIFDSRIRSNDFSWAMTEMAIVLLAAAVLVAVLLEWSGAAYRGPGKESTTRIDRRRLLWVLWFGYGCGAAAGLMAIAHATGLVQSAGGGVRILVYGAMLIGIGNALGGAVAGWLTDNWSLRGLLSALPLVSACVLVALMGVRNPVLCIAALCLLGFTYGAIIAVYPAAVSHYVGAREAPRAYGRVFTAWGLAGLGAPWLAGWIFDRYGDYGPALAIAALAALLSAASVLLLPRHRSANF